DELERNVTRLEEARATVERWVLAGRDLAQLVHRLVGERPACGGGPLRRRGGSALGRRRLGGRVAGVERGQTWRGECRRGPGRFRLPGSSLSRRLRGLLLSEPSEPGDIACLQLDICLRLSLERVELLDQPDGEEGEAAHDHEREQRPEHAPGDGEQQGQKRSEPGQGQIAPRVWTRTVV